MAVLLVLIMVGTSFTSLASYAVGQEIDSDRDGYSDKYERLMGTNPDDPNDYPGSNSTNGPDKPGGPSIIESFQIDVLPSSRIVHEDQPISVAVYVRKDGDLVGQRLVHMMVFQASGQFLDLVAAQKDVLDNGRASFQYSHPTTGVVYFVATMEDNGADLGEHTTIASVVAKKTNMRVGFVNIAVYQRYFATIGADFLHLLPGMMAGLTMNLYELRTSGLSDDVVDKWVDRTTPLPALDDIYAPASGTVHLTGVGPGAFYVQQDVQCEGTSCSYVNILPSIGQYSFHASGYQDSRFVSDVAFVTVHDPIYRDISIFDHYNLFETGQLQVSVKKVSSALDRDEFDRLMTEVDGSMAGFAKAHPDLMAPIVGHADFYFIYMKHSEALVLKHGEMIYNGTGFDTYTFGVPGNYRVVVVDGPIGCPDGIFSDFGMVPSTAFQQNIVVATDFLMTTFPNKLSYFPAEHVMLTTMFTSGDKVVRDMPVALYVDGKYVDQSQIKPGEFVVQHDLGMMAQGGHTVTTFPITSQDSKKVLNAFNAQSFHEPWVGNAGFNVRGIGIYLDLPGKAVKGLPFSFRLVALDAPMQPCTGCAYKAWLVQGEETMQVASGSTDDAGAAAVTFNFPDIYFDAIRIDVTKDGSNSSMVRSLEPRAQLLTGITITNKPLYKAGETVMLRFLIWNQDQVAPGTGDLDVRVRDPEGRELSRQKLALDAFGSAQLQVPLATDQREGDYTVEAWVSGIEDPIIESTFKVEAYTTPTVEVVFENTKDVVDQWTTNFTVPYSVKYMFGKEVTEGGISWEAGFIRKGYKNEHTIIAGEAKVNGTWPMKVKFDLTNMVLPNDQVYVKIDFKDRFGHNATGKLLLGVTEAKTLYNLDVVLDKKEYNPGDPVGIRVSLNKEDRSLGKSTIKPMGGETVVLSVQAPDGTGHTSQVLIGQDGNWTGTLAGLGVDADKFHRTGKLTNITLEADYQHLIFTAKIVNIVFKTVEPVLSTDKDGYAAGQDAVIYVAIRDLVNNAFLSGPYSVKVQGRRQHQCPVLFDRHARCLLHEPCLEGPGDPFHGQVRHRGGRGHDPPGQECPGRGQDPELPQGLIVGEHLQARRQDRAQGGPRQALHGPALCGLHGPGPPARHEPEVRPADRDRSGGPHGRRLEEPHLGLRLLRFIHRGYRDRQREGGPGLGGAQGQDRHEQGRVPARGHHDTDPRGHGRGRDTRPGRHDGPVGHRRIHLRPRVGVRRRRLDGRLRGARRHGQGLRARVRCDERPGQAPRDLREGRGILRPRGLFPEPGHGP